MKSINIFWNWFLDNNNTIQNIIKETPENQMHILFWLNKNLTYYCEEITFMIIFPKIPQGKTELIITANNNPDYFRQVIDLIDNAPRLRAWKFTAFIQTTDKINKIIEKLDEPYIVPEITLKASELKSIPIDYKEKTKKHHIIIHLKEYNIYCNTKTWKQALFIIMKGFIYDNISFVQLAQILNQEELIHLYEFQLYIDESNVE